MSVEFKLLPQNEKFLAGVNKHSIPHKWFPRVSTPGEKVNPLIPPRFLALEISWKPGIWFPRVSTHISSEL